MIPSPVILIWGPSSKLDLIAVKRFTQIRIYLLGFINDATTKAYYQNEYSFRVWIIIIEIQQGLKNK